MPALPRRRSEERVYSTLFYHTRCKHVVEDFIKKNNTPSQEHVAERARITADLYASEEDYIKEAVKAEIRELEEKREATKVALEALEQGTALEANVSPLEYAQ